METNDVIEALAALAHGHRLAIFRLLVEKGPEGLSAGEIAERLGLAPSSLTFHLQHLTRAALLTQRRVGRQLFYAADFGVMTALVGYLTENCCSGASCEPTCATDDTARRTPAGARAGSRRRHDSTLRSNPR
jgi:ArsR family transcriptional regulator, arsenate/arsenite/antimonite-responsive transcriptional repressor